MQFFVTPSKSSQRIGKAKLCATTTQALCAVAGASIVEARSSFSQHNQLIEVLMDSGDTSG